MKNEKWKEEKRIKKMNKKIEDKRLKIEKWKMKGGKEK
jgi:hypothetical protein